jgi:hypothetical protein
MKYFNFFQIAAYFLLLSLAFVPVAVSSNSKECLNQSKLFIKEKEKVQFDGGFWSLFEKSKEFNLQSVKGLKLDNQINKLVEHIIHLCKTLNGIPLNDLAMIIRDDLKIMTEMDYRNELEILGKTKKDIEIWFQFYDFSLEHEHRALNYQSVQQTIKSSKSLILAYTNLHLDNNTRINSISFASEVEFLINQFLAFSKSDKNIAQAEYELSQTPYWDIQESVGGS